MKKFMGGLLLIGGFVFSSAQTISFEKTTIDYGIPHYPHHSL
jgi:hypothetical protein